jgi:Protein of unknown function (DUF3296).
MTLIRLNHERKGDVIIDPAKARLKRLRRRIHLWCSAVQTMWNSRRYRRIMVTLTYVGVNDWEPNHIRDYLRAVRRHCKKKLVAYAWVAELQKRGAVHYHVLLITERDVWIPTPDDSGMWPHGSSEIAVARRPWYIMKYASKEYVGDGIGYPKHARIFAVWVRPGAISPEWRWHLTMSARQFWLYEEMMQAGLVGLYPRKIVLPWVTYWDLWPLRWYNPWRWCGFEMPEQLELFSRKLDVQ